MCIVKLHHTSTPAPQGKPSQLTRRPVRLSTVISVPSRSFSARCSTPFAKACIAQPAAAAQDQPSTALQVEPVSTQTPDRSGSPGLSADAIQLLAQQSGLSTAALQSISNAAAQYTSISNDETKLLARIRALQELLGPDNADTLIRINAQMLGRRPETLAANLQQWSAFLPHLSREQLLRKLSSSPGLLAGSTFKAVPNLYEQAVILGIKRAEWDAFAARNPSLGSYLPDTIEHKVKLVVQVLSRQLHEDPADLSSLASGTSGSSSITTSSEGTSSRGGISTMDTTVSSSKGSSSVGMGYNHDSSSSSSSSSSIADGSTVEAAQSSPTVHHTSTANALKMASATATGTMSAVAGSGSDTSPSTAWRSEAEVLQLVRLAAQRQPRWLTLSDALLRQRLQGLLELLQGCAAAARVKLPRDAVTKVFARQPTLVCRPTRVVSDTAAAFLQLPGLHPTHGLGMLLAMPALLEYSPARVVANWATINAAASSSAVWADQLANLAPSTVAGMLLKSEQRLARLALLASANQQGCIAMTTALNFSEHKFAARFPQ